MRNKSKWLRSMIAVAVSLLMMCSLSPAFAAEKTSEVPKKAEDAS